MKHSTIYPIYFQARSIRTPRDKTMNEMNANAVWWNLIAAMHKCTIAEKLGTSTKSASVAFVILHSTVNDAHNKAVPQ